MPKSQSIGRCPGGEVGSQCSGTIRIRPDQDEVTCPECGITVTRDSWSSLMMKHLKATGLYASGGSGVLKPPMSETEIRAQAWADTADRLRALAALMEFIADGEDNLIRVIRDFANGQGDDDNDPRVQARRYGLEW